MVANAFPHLFISSADLLDLLVCSNLNNLHLYLELPGFVPPVFMVEEVRAGSGPLGKKIRQRGRGSGPGGGAVMVKEDCMWGGRLGQ